MDVLPHQPLISAFRARPQFALPRVLSLCVMLSLVSACNSGGDAGNVTASAANSRTATNQAAFSDVVAPSACSEGDQPEPGIQGRVPIEDRASGRSQAGYTCNLKRIGQYQGEGSTWVNPSFKNCAYMATSFSGIPSKKMQGVQVIDVSDTQNPKYVKSLDSMAFFQSTWESLKVNETRQLLAGVAGGPIISAGFIDIYDISGDCTQPKLLNPLAGSQTGSQTSNQTGQLTVPANLLGHEGNFSPDGNTYWATSSAGGSITAIDIKNPAQPRPVFIGNSLFPNHGFSFNADGTRMYLTTAGPSGVLILDVSSVQRRDPVPVVRPVGSVFWLDGAISQHTIPVQIQGKPHLIVVDEFGTGATRFVDISNEAAPKVISKIRLEIQRPEHTDKRRADLGNNGVFGYEAHYCAVDRAIEPQALACGYFQSGVRVFDIRDPLKPKEIAYYNPPAQAANRAILQGSEHVISRAGKGPSVSDVQNLGIGIPTKLQADADLSTDWCTSPPRFVDNQLWVVCQDNGFMVLEFAKGVYPFASQ